MSNEHQRIRIDLIFKKQEFYKGILSIYITWYTFNISANLLALAILYGDDSSAGNSFIPIWLLPSTWVIFNFLGVIAAIPVIYFCINHRHEVEELTTGLPFAEFINPKTKWIEYICFPLTLLMLLFLVIMWTIIGFSSPDHGSVQP